MDEKLNIIGAKTLTVKGIKGDQGDPGKDGRSGLDGKNGKDGLNGLDGTDGKDGLDGTNGLNGKDGSPDSAKEIKTKLESLKGESRLDAKAIKNLPQFTREIVHEANFRAGAMETPIKAGSNITVIKDASGAFVISSIVGPDTGITELTGDVTAGPGSGTQVATLATVNSNVGTFGNSTNVSQVTVDAKGRVTAASNVPISFPAGFITGITDTTSIDLTVSSGNLSAVRAALTGDITAPADSNITTLATVNGNVGSFTTANITVDAKGRITAASSGTSGVSPTPNTIADDEIYTISANQQVTYSGLIYIREGGQIYTQNDGVLSWVN